MGAEKEKNCGSAWRSKAGRALQLDWDAVAYLTQGKPNLERLRGSKEELLGRRAAPVLVLVGRARNATNPNELHEGTEQRQRGDECAPFAVDASEAQLRGREANCEIRSRD